MATNYNPDVLNCLANLSNDEVFTPPALANKVLDLLPQELFKSADTKFLDPFTKSGVFLREIVKRLDRGLQDVIPDRQQRIDHILHEQVYGIACTELTALLSRRSLYCSKFADGQYSVSKFADKDGQILYNAIKHTWKDGKCKFCGASQNVFDRGEAAEQYAFHFIHTDNPSEIFNMKFDVVIGNPPYQMADGGGKQTGSSTGSAIPLYQRFVQQAKKLNPRYLTMIIPSRWFSGGKGLDDFRDEMLNDSSIATIVDYPDSRECFPGVDIAGGVCFFLRDQNHKGLCKVISISGITKTETDRKLNEFPVFIRYATAIDIIKKVGKKKEKMMSDYVYSRNPFGFQSFEEGHATANIDDIELLGSKGISFIARNNVLVNSDLIDHWKVVMSKASAEHAGQTDNEGKKKIVSRIEVLAPGVICTETYLLLATFDSQEKANNLRDYVKTIFFRFLMSTILLTQNIAKDKFQFIPMPDCSIKWTDELLYKKYKLSTDEIAFMASQIKPME